MLTQIRIQNFRKIEDLTLNLNPWTVMLRGGNCTNKTSILDAIHRVVTKQCPDRASMDIGEWGPFTRLTAVFFNGKANFGYAVKISDRAIEIDKLPKYDMPKRLPRATYLTSPRPRSGFALYESVLQTAVKSMPGSPNIYGKSSGESALASILSAVWYEHQERPGLVLIDDITEGLSVSWCRSLVKILMSLMPDNQYIMTSNRSEKDLREILQTSGGYDLQDLDAQTSV